VVDVTGGEFVDAKLHGAHGLRAEPVAADCAHHAVLRVVHVDQRADADASLDFVGLRSHQHRTGRVGEHVVGVFDRHDVGVLGDGPERAITVDVDP
jgi:hypothetical protein